MRKFTLIPIALGLSSLGFASGLRAEIDAVNSKICSAIMHRDGAAFEKIVKAGVTKDFKYSENGQTQTLDQMIANMKMGFAMLTKVKSATAKITTFKQSGSSATATIAHMMAGTMTGPDKKPHTMTFSGTSTNVYRMEGKEWKLASMTWGKQTMLMDGKPFDPSKMAPSKQ